MTAMITTAQIRTIHAALSRRGIDDETYRALLREQFDGVASCKDLSRSDAHRLINTLFGGPLPRRRQRIRTPADPRPVGDGDGDDAPVRLVSPLQRRLIDALVSEIAWDSADGYRHWLRRSLGLVRVRTQGDATAVIRGLKGLKQHGHALETQ